MGIGCLGAAAAEGPFAAGGGAAVEVLPAEGAVAGGGTAVFAAEGGSAIGAAPIGVFTGLSIAMIGPGVPGSARAPFIASAGLALGEPAAPAAGVPDAVVVAGEDA